MATTSSTKPVEVTAATVPVDAAAVEITAKTQHARPTTPDPALTLSPGTTAEQDRQSYGQRRINIMWEATQAIVTVSIVAALVYAQLKAIEAKVLENMALMIAAMYYTRTNHTKVGGVAPGDQR